MNEAEVQAILARADAATPGPWERHADGCGQVWAQEFPVAYCDTQEMGEGFTTTQFNLNAAFVAAARQDVPALARELLALRVEREAVRESLRWALGYMEKVGSYVRLLQGQPDDGAALARALALLEEKAKP